jgi:hypothetical protein
MRRKWPHHPGGLDPRQTAGTPAAFRAAIVLGRGTLLLLAVTAGHQAPIKSRLCPGKEALAVQTVAVSHMTSELARSKAVIRRDPRRRREVRSGVGVTVELDGSVDGQPELAPSHLGQMDWHVALVEPALEQDETALEVVPVGGELQ